MEWNVQISADGANEIAAANYPEIRLFHIPKVPSGTPAPNVQAAWSACSPQAIPSFSAVAYYFGREIHKEVGVPVGLINTSWGGTRIEPWIPPTGFESQEALKAELDGLRGAQAAWQATLKSTAAEFAAWVETAKKAEAAGEEIPPPPAVPNHPLNGYGASTGLYNGMVHAIVPYGIRGALWYQGESNRGQGMHYHDLMKGLIGGWRSVWGQGDFPFLFVQLAPFRYDANITALPEIWEAQAATLSVPNTGMAVTTDIGNVTDIHPANKQDVGRRLARWALAKTYGKSDLAYSGPVFESMAIAGDQAELSFAHSTGGLVSRNGKPLTWFSIAGEDKRFYPAEAAIRGDKVVVRSLAVPAPVHVRFGWHQEAEPNLANAAGLPASPFRTDTWTDATPAVP
jgi:sialate O-acetylesterase